MLFLYIFYITPFLMFATFFITTELRPSIQCYQLNLGVHLKQKLKNGWKSLKTLLRDQT